LVRRKHPALVWSHGDELAELEPREPTFGIGLHDESGVSIPVLERYSDGIRLLPTLRLSDGSAYCCMRGIPRIARVTGDGGFAVVAD
jgi:hypothetical protein